MSVSELKSGPSAISLPSGSMVTLGGIWSEDQGHDGAVWLAGKNNQWSNMGNMALVSLKIFS